MDLVLGFQDKVGLDMMGRTERMEEPFQGEFSSIVSQCHGFRKAW